VFHVVHEAGVLVLRENRVLVSLWAAEPVGMWTALVRIRVRRQNYGRLRIVHEARGDAFHAAATVRPDHVAARVLLARARPLAVNLIEV